MNQNPNGSNEELQAVSEREKLYRQIIEYSVETIIIHADHRVLYINESGANFLRASKEQIIGASVLDIIQEDHKEAIKARIQKVMTEQKPAELIEQTMLRLDGTPVDVEVNCNPVLYGDKRAIQSVLRDITKRRVIEEEQRKLMREINEVSAPIVPILDGIAVLPLVGSIDAGRAEQLLNDIPMKVKNQRVEVLIIDFSGIHNLDAVIVEHLLMIDAVLRLLGVRTIVSGMKPEFARIVVQLNLDLGSMYSVTTVQQALRQLGLAKTQGS